ncbi:hypothetical protein Ancab_015941 [Ancistrocladus abbreviatus]
MFYRKQEDGVRAMRVVNLNNPYKTQDNFDDIFQLTMNDLYAWILHGYDRVVMLDSDNLFVQKTDEPFHCGAFCVVFINSTLPSKGVFQDMIPALERGRANPDGADRGFLGRFPSGYQRDTSYYCEW